MARHRKKTAARHALDIGFAAPWVMAQRLAAAPDFAAWQRFAAEKWLAAMQGTLAAAHAGMTSPPWPAPVTPWGWWSAWLPAAERIGAAALAPVSRRVTANARGLARPRRR